MKPNHGGMDVQSVRACHGMERTNTAPIAARRWTVKRMTTDELIRALREYADADEMPLRLVRNAMTEAADRLEELDERVAIMRESMEAEWGRG